jgi:hypothetical protein
LKINQFPFCVALLLVAGSGFASSLDDPSAAHYRARMAFGDLFINRDFVGIDALVEKSINERRVIEDGDLLLPEMSGLYDAMDVSMNPDERRKGKASLREEIEAWQRANPHSSAALIAEAMMWRRWAYVLRGGCCDDDDPSSPIVNPRAKRYFLEYMDKSYKTLVAHKKIAAQNPYYFEFILLLQAERGIPVADSEKIYIEAVAAHPWYYSYHRAMIYVIAKSGQGRGARAAEFINSVTKNANDEMYARLWRAYDILDHHHTNLFEDTPVDWPRMRNGLLQGLSAKPNSSANTVEQMRLRRAASYACRAGDWATFQLVHPEATVSLYDGNEWPMSFSEALCNRMASANRQKKQTN